MFEIFKSLILQKLQYLSDYLGCLIRVRQLAREKEATMEKSEKAEGLREWVKVLKDHPKFARAFLAQQVILIEASELGYRLIDARMCKLLERGFVVPFMEYWLKRCKKLVRVELGGFFGCLASTRDPADCFRLPHEDGWFDDPFAGGRILPPKPPIPPLTPSR